MKINMNEFNEHLAALAGSDVVARQRAIAGLAQHASASWEGAPDAVTTVIKALIGDRLLRPAGKMDPAFRAEAVKALGNIGTHSPSVIPELTRIVEEDSDAKVRTEAARALGKIGTEAITASKALTKVLASKTDERLRGEAARALARVDPENANTATVLKTAAGDKSGYVSICAAEALASVSTDAGPAVMALASRLTDAAVRAGAAQALYRIGPKAAKAVPALLAAAKDKDRLFHESVVMALKKIDPHAANIAGMK